MTVYFGAAALIFLLVWGLDRLSLNVVAPVRRAPDRTVPETGLDHEDFAIRSGDHDLGAWLLKPAGDPQDPLVLLAHGWGANYSALLRLAEPLVALGYEVLLFDVRGHGRNEPVPVVTIRHFRDDVTAVLAFAASRWPDRPVVLVGHSLGGSAGILAAAEGAPVDGLVAVASPSDVITVTAEYLSEQGLPGTLMTRLFLPFWWRRAGSLFGPLTPARRVRDLSVPLRLVQPEHDARVSRGHAEALSAASGQPYTLVEGAEHTDVLARPETLAVVENLIEELESERDVEV